MFIKMLLNLQLRILSFSFLRLFFFLYERFFLFSLHLFKQAHSSIYLPHPLVFSFFLSFTSLFPFRIICLFKYSSFLPFHTRSVLHFLLSFFLSFLPHHFLSFLSSFCLILGQQYWSSYIATCLPSNPLTWLTVTTRLQSPIVEFEAAGIGLHYTAERGNLVPTLGVTATPNGLGGV